MQSKYCSEKTYSSNLFLDGHGLSYVIYQNILSLIGSVFQPNGFHVHYGFALLSGFQNRTLQDNY